MLGIIHSTQADSQPVRVLISMAMLMPLGFLFGFAFPTGMRVISDIDPEPAPWFWGINGACGVTGSVLAVMVSIAFGINVAIAVAGVCYLGVIVAGQYLLGLRAEAARSGASGEEPSQAPAAELVETA
jgi:hypothetical protein